jgi:hypothetical protein
VAPPKSDFEKQMHYLEAELRRLEAEFNMFFAGRLPRPPWETKTKVATLIKRHDQSHIPNTADRFRFETLQNRFYKYTELVDRQMTNRELGRPVFGTRKEQPPPPLPEPSMASTEGATPPASRQSAPDNARATADKARNDERVVRFDKGAKGEERIKELYDTLSAARQKAGEAPLPFDRVAALVKAQVDKLGGDGADFRIAMKDGKVSLTVKPVKDE